MEFALSKLKLTTIGISIGVIMKAMLARINFAEKDLPRAAEEPSGPYRPPHDPAFAEKMEKAESIMRRYRSTLRALSL